MTKTYGLKKIETGNNGSYVRGIDKNENGFFLAITATWSHEYKTLRGAVNAMAKRGYDAFGERLNETSFVKVQDYTPAGDYKNTRIDDEKASADIRILQMGPVVVDSKIPLKGRGIKPLSVQGRYSISRAVLSRLQKNHAVVTDF